MDIACQKTGYTSDYIEFRDGGNENSQMMGRFCGNSTNIPSHMQTSQNFLWVRWEMFVNTNNYLFIILTFYVGSNQTILTMEVDSSCSTMC